MSDRRDDSKPVAPDKRPYRQPRLFLYGDVAKLTRAKDFTSMTRDGAIGMWWGLDVPLRS